MRPSFLAKGRLAALGLLLLGGCSPDLVLREGARISCTGAADCPSGLVCHNGLCVDAAGLDTTPPDLASAPQVSPGTGRAGTPFQILLEPTEPLAEPPEVLLRLLVSAVAPCAAEGAGWRCTYTATGEENGGQGGAVPFDVHLLDRGGNETVRRLAGSFHLDFAPPALRLANVTYLPAPSNPLPTVTGATVGTRVVVTLTADEVLDTAVPPSLEARLGGAVLPFSLVEGSLAANSAGFVATVPAGLVDGDYALAVTWSDEVGNGDTAEVASPVVRVKTSVPTLTVNQSSVTYLRAPWGVADVGMPITSPSVPAGQVFAALAPGDPLSAATLLDPSAFTAPGGIAILRIWKDAARTSMLAGRVSPEPGGWPRFLVPGGEELPTVWVTAVDAAGNESAAVRLANAEWIATAGKPAVGASPHRVHTSYYAPDTLALGRSVSEPHPAASPLLGLVQQAHSALRSRYAERKVGPSPRREFGAAFDVARGVMVLHGGISASGQALDDTWEWNGTSWTEVASATGFVPGPTPPPPMTYDGARGRVVLEDSDYTLWEWDGAGWEQTTRAAGNWRGYMAYDPAAERVVMTPNGHPQFLDTMEWDGYAWAHVAGATPPGPRERGAMAYDAHRGVMVFFGGRDPSYAGTTTYGELWERDASGWRLVAQAGAAPGPRHGHGLVYDASAGRLLLVGGADGSGALRSDVRAWDGATWTDVTPAGPAPPPRRNAAVAFDPARSRLILHGGLGAGDALLDDTWELGSSGWEDVSVTRVTPPPRWAHALAYDPVRQVIVLHGGASLAGVDETVWEYDGQWRSVTLSAGQPGPGRRTSHAMVFHAATGRMLVFGGSGPYGPASGVWQWTGAGWIDRTPAGVAPPHREGFASSYDPSAGVVRMTGGLVYDGAWRDLTDHWELSAGGLMAWFQRSSTVPPGVARSIHAQLWDGSRTLLMCGYNQSSGAMEDAWGYDGSTWTRVAAAATGQGLSRGGAVWDPVRRRGVLLGDPYLETGFYRLEWLGDRFRAIAPTATERWPMYNRNETAIAYDARRNRTVVFGGFERPASLALGDTWEVDADLDAQGLQRRSPAVQFTVRYDGAGFPLSRVTGLRVRARAGGAFAPAGAGARLLGWHRGGPEAPGGGWVALADNTAGLPLAGSPAGLLEWAAPPAELVRFFRERDSEVAFRLRPAGAPPADADEAVVQAEYVEVRVRYSTAP